MAKLDFRPSGCGLPPRLCPYLRGKYGRRVRQSGNRPPNRIADSSVGIALSQLHRPVHHAIFCCDRRFCVCNAIVAVHAAAHGRSGIGCAAEICPFSVQIVLNFLVFLCSVQFDLDSMKIREGFFSEFQHNLARFRPFPASALPAGRDSPHR